MQNTTVMWCCQPGAVSWCPRSILDWSLGCTLLAEERGLSQTGKASGTRRLWRRFDVCLLAGIAVAVGAAIAGLRSTGIRPSYFFQPTGAFIVLGGTLGVMLLTTPGDALLSSLRRVLRLFSPASGGAEALIEEIAICARASRREGPVGLEVLAKKAANPFLRDSLMLVCDVNDREQIQDTLETALRLRERQGEADVRTFEVAGGFAPTIGIMGTVVGLIEVMRQFGSIQAVGYGIGTAFLSTLYGLAAANLLLLPVAHRIRARAAEELEIQELIAEGVVSIADGIHPALIRARLREFVRTREKAVPPQKSVETGKGVYA